jgi:O-antigen ligase
MAESVNSDYMAEDMPENEQYFTTDYSESEGRNDGWWVAFLVFAIIFGPQTRAFAALPPIRFDDFVIVFLLVARWMKTSRLYGDFLFSPRIRPYSVSMLVLIFIMCFSMTMNYATGRNPVFIKDLWIPVSFIRMILIAAIAASFNFQRRQARQFIMGISLISLLSVVLAFSQQNDIYGVLGLTEKLYPVPAESKMMAYGSSRVIGTFGNPNHFGGSLAMLSATILAFATNIKGLTRYFSIAVFISLGAAILITTASRTALFGYLAVSGISLVLSMRRGSRFPAFLAMIVIIGTIMFVRGHVYELPLQQRVQDILTGQETSLRNSFEARLGIWIDNMRMAKDSLFLGVGPTKSFVTTADNGYIYMLVRLGIFGLLTYLLMLLGLFSRGIRAFFHEQSPHKRAIILGTTMVLVNHTVFEITGDFFWGIKYGAVLSVFFGILCGLARQIMDEKSLFDNYEQSAQNYFEEMTDYSSEGGQLNYHSEI